MSIRKLLAAVAAPLAVLGAVAFGTGAAHAAPLPVPAGYSAYVGGNAVTVSANDGGSAAVNAADTLSLTVGSPSSTAFAQAVLSLPAGSVLSHDVPSFTTDNYAAGSPRWVIELGNGDHLFGYPAQLGGTANTSFTGNQWEADTHSGTALTSPLYTTYAAAVAAAGGFGETVTSAYVVEDGDQAAGTVDTISHLAYGGHHMVVLPFFAPRPHLLHGHIISVSNNKAELGWTYAGYGSLKECAITQTFGYKMTAANGTAHKGFTCYNAATDGTMVPHQGIGFWWGLVAGHTYDISFTPAYANGTPIPGARVGWINVVTTK
jgi:hypothetical protein